MDLNLFCADFKGSERLSGISPLSGYMVNSATIPGDVLYIAGQPRYNHTGQVIIYRMEDGDIRILQTLSGEQVSLKIIVLN